MPKITYILPDGLETVLDAEPGSSVMRAAVSNGIPGIVAECGGSAMCATCHVYVETENPEMLDCTASERCANSRLSCQLQVSEDITVRLPETQV
jgi:2Fe-2S ferredoxin